MEKVTYSSGGSMVAIYVLPLLTLLLNFLAFGSCLRFLFSRQGLYWFIPLLLTLFLIVPNALTLYTVASDPNSFISTGGILTYQPLGLSLLWYLLIITFHYALKKTIRINRYEADMRKNLHEARYQAKIESRQLADREKSRKERFAGNRSVVPRTNTHPLAWVELFED
ncbi:MAG: hypothetical protein QM442_02640 [Spirochaetota bacterium]|nr:hypothetical protein [Spirochaetota bacterium]